VQPAVLSASSLCFSYGEREVLHNVTITVEGGELLGLIGPNGAGKTTLLHLLSGYLEPSKGTVTLAGNPMPRLTRREIAQTIAVVPQSTETVFSQSVLQVVLMGRHPYAGFTSLDSRQDLTIADEQLSRLGLSDFAQRNYNQLSGGEQRLVLIARALAQQTPIILLDEPLAELDLKHQATILRLLKELTAEGKAILASFHDLNAALHWCDTAILLANGHVAAAGRPDAVLLDTRLSEVYNTQITWSTAPHLAIR
jgi:iron complex transport system ATP-binding protein